MAATVARSRVNRSIVLSLGDRLAHRLDPRQAGEVNWAVVVGEDPGELMPAALAVSTGAGQTPSLARLPLPHKPSLPSRARG